VRLLPPEEELLLARPRLDELDRLREPEPELDRLRELEPLERFVPLARPRDELPELRDRLFVPEDEARPRDRLELDRELLPPLCCCLPSSSPFPSSFLPTATAAGTATPMAAPAATFFPVDMPSFSSISLISTSFSCCRSPR
jgi:hypothetical protein